MARGKLYAACVIRGDEPVIQDMMGELEMLIDDVKDNPVARQFIEIAGKERIELAERLGIAKGIVRTAMSRKLDLPYSEADTVEYLAANADEETLLAINAEVSAANDFNDLLRSRGVKNPEPGF